MTDGELTIADLGRFSGPMLLFGGPYSNAHATRALMDEASRLSIAPDHWLCTGDVCAYCADPVETTRLIRESGCAVIMGNCEESLGNREDACGCGFDDGAACDVLAGQWYAYANAALGEEDRGWMRTRPRIAIFTQAGKRFAAIHGGAEIINRFLWPTLPDHVFAEEIALLERLVGKLDGVIAGHAGMAFERQVDGVHWINAGAIGLPAHDGDPRTSFAVLESGAVRFHRLSYDHEGAAESMRLARLTAGYNRSLLSGWWPSEDSFPDEMKIGRVA